MEEGAELIIPLKPDFTQVRLGEHAVLQLAHTASPQDAPTDSVLEIRVGEYGPGKLHILLDPVGDFQSFYRITLDLPEAPSHAADRFLGGAVFRRLRSGYTEDTRWDPTAEGVQCRASEVDPASLVLISLPLQRFVPAEILQFHPVLLRGNFVFEPREASGDPQAPAALFSRGGSSKPLHPENFGLLQLSDEA